MYQGVGGSARDRSGRVHVRISRCATRSRSTSGRSPRPKSHRRDLAGALERLARSLAASGATERALTIARRWLELDLLHEPAHRLLMDLLARAGEAAAAISQYRDCVRILDRELGVAPLPETTELYEAIRAGRPSAQSAALPPDAPSAAALASAGATGAPTRRTRPPARGDARGTPGCGPGWPPARDRG